MRVGRGGWGVKPIYKKVKATFVCSVGRSKTTQKTTKKMSDGQLKTGRTFIKGGVEGRLKTYKKALFSWGLPL